MIELIFATHNAHKVEEVLSIIDPTRFNILSLEDLGYHEEIIESGSSLEANARIKADTIFNTFGRHVISEDTGLEVEALDMAPGVHTARYAGSGKDANANMDKLLSELDNLERSGSISRNAQFRAVVALWFNDKSYLFEGIVRGRIARSKMGDGGFGYDPIFIPEGYNQSFGQLSAEVKNELSHRARAFRKLSDFLDGM